jgi:hypothetical protein
MRGRRGVAAAAAAALLATPPLLASGGPPLTHNFIDPSGGSPGELARIWRGRLPVVMPSAREGMLYMAWRLLHGLPVGDEAGAALSVPCCDVPWEERGPGVWGWIEARRLVAPPEPDVYHIPTERPGPDYTSFPNCFDEAFERATATLKDRVRRYGARSPWVRAWVGGQDAVFDTCADANAVLPALPAGAPAWLRADRAYQEAAFALYHGRNVEAAERFGAIARDPASPWRPLGLYLRARALHRHAIAHRHDQAFAEARAAIAQLQSAPADTFGSGEAVKMLNALTYRQQPKALLAELESALAERRIGKEAPTSLRDYLTLSRKADVPPEAADWILTISAERERKDAALARAQDRWRSGRDPAWLLAALSLADAGTPEAAGLVADAEAIADSHPGWRTIEYHRLRLTLAADPDGARRSLDSILAEPALSRSERNLFSALRTQVAGDLRDFARFALRRPACSKEWHDCHSDPYWGVELMTARLPGGETVAFGQDALAIVDRLTLDRRIALSRDPSLPRELRLDIALSSFARAVQLRRDAAIDGLARDLQALLPQMRQDWAAIRAARPGPAKRFATYFAMAKLPGLRTDLFGYTRPSGTIAQFRGYWVDWMIQPPGARPTPAEPPPPGSYFYGDWWPGEEDRTDLTCLAECGLGRSSLRLPDFAAAEQEVAAVERAFLLREPGYGEADTRPAGAVSVWEELLAWARAYPRDPRSPESLYWLIRIARWGANHDHIGKRAFQLLHRRYPGSVWAKRSPYYYDDPDYGA